MVLWAAASLVTAAPPPLRREHQTENVFLIISDGFRWQEVFGGAEEALMSKTNGG